MLRTFCILLAAFSLSAGKVAAQSPEPASLRGVVRALNEAAISSDMSTRVVRLPFRDGDAFKMNDVLVEFDCERLRAELKAAEAERRGLHAAWENSARLYQLKAAGGHDVTMAAAAHDKSAAAAEGIKVRIKQCQIIAPFDGRVTELSVRMHETPPSNQPIIKILDDKALEIDLLLPAASFPEIKAGTLFQLKIDETGVMIDGEIIRVGASLDIVSQTFKAAGRPQGQFRGIIPGMSGSIILTKFRS